MTESVAFIEDNYEIPPLDEIHPYDGKLCLVALPSLRHFAVGVKKIIDTDPQMKEKLPPITVLIKDFELVTYDNDETDVEMTKEGISKNKVVLMTTGPGTPLVRAQTNDIVVMLAARRAGEIAVMSNYFPRCRSDAENSKVTPMSQVAAEEWQHHARGKLDRIITFDLHAKITGFPGLITEIKMLRRPLKAAIVDARKISDRIVILFPDGTAEKRSRYAKTKIEEEEGVIFPKVLCIKYRTSSSSCEILSLVGEPEAIAAIKDATVISADDEMLSGGSNHKAAELVKSKKYGAARVWNVITHGVLTGTREERESPNFPQNQILMQPNSPIDRIYMTNTIPVNDRPLPNALIAAGKLKVIDITRDMAWILAMDFCNINIRDIR